jgi:hypothetical protein
LKMKWLHCEAMAELPAQPTAMDKLRADWDI